MISVADLAAEFGVAESTVMDWRRTYQWPYVKVGRRFFWTPEQVEEIKRAHTVAAGQVERSDGRTQRSASRRRSSP